MHVEMSWFQTNLTVVFVETRDLVFYKKDKHSRKHTYLNKPCIIMCNTTQVLHTNKTICNR